MGTDYRLDYWIEAVQCSLDENGLFGYIPKELIKSIAKDMHNAYENIGMAFGDHVARSPVETDKDRKIKALEAQVKELEKDIYCYKSNVARRRHVEPNEVYLSNSGEVMYDRR